MPEVTSRECLGASLPNPSVVRASYYRARYYDPKSGRFASEDPLPYDFTSFYSYVENNPATWTDPLGLWKCAPGANCGDLLPALIAALDCLENHTVPLTVTCGADSHPPKIGKNGNATGDPHFWGAAVDIGNNTNPGLSTELFGKAFKECFPHKKFPRRTWGSYAQPEYNSSNPDDGWHFHIQYFGGSRGGEGFVPDPIHPHGH